MNFQAGNSDNRLYSLVYRADGLRVVKEKVSLAAMAVGGGGEAGGSLRTEYLYDGPMPVCEQEFVGGTLRTTRVNFVLRQFSAVDRPDP